MNGFTAAFLFKVGDKARSEWRNKRKLEKFKIIILGTAYNNYEKWYEGEVVPMLN
jgi:hypothetical protein